MFSGRGKKRDVSTRGTNEWEEFNFDIPNLDEVEVSEHLDENDLNDPDLLKELQALSGIGAPKPKPKSKPKPAASQNYLDGLDLDALQNLGDEEEVEVELTEEDLNDPNLLSQLSAFESLEEVEKGGSQTTAVPEVDTVPEPSKVDMPPSHLDTNEEKPKVAEGTPVTCSSNDVESSRVEAIPNLSPTEIEAEVPVSLVDVTEPIEPTPPTVPKPDPSVQIELIKQRMQEFKQAALFYKRHNDMPTARSMLAISKSLQQPLDILSLGGQLDEHFELPSVPVLTPPPTTKGSEAASPMPPKTASKPSPAKREPKSDGKKSTRLQGVTESFDLREVMEDPMVSQITSKSPKEQYSEMCRQLEQQITYCTSIAAHYYKAGEKASALQFHKLKKSFLADLASLRSYEEHQRPVPRFHYQDVTYMIENAFYDIPVNEMEFEIVRGFHLGVKEVSGNNVDAYVSFDLGWPTEGSGPGKGDTAVIRKSMDPEFQFNRRIPIERTRSFQRFVERKKAVFEVFHYRGFLWRAVSLGKVQVKLDRLLHRCEIHEVLELLDANRRPTGGKLEIKIRLRNPLLKADISTKSEKWLFLEFDQPGNPSAAPIPASSPAPAPAPAPASAPAQPVATDPQPPRTEASPTQPADVDVKMDAPSPHPSDKSKPSQQKKSQAPSAVEEPDELQLAIEEFNSPDKLVSNMVLEQELQLVQARISQSRQPADDLLDRQQALDIKMNMLVIQVQTGQLTMDGYLQQVREAIRSTKRLALIFKNHQNMELAKHALARIKTMSQEVEEAEKAMAEGLME
ncbi:hypothetical protein K493DRAFT_342720 [Basidiobolus meristosporus CBS 931.73]|uniref:C2 domain-containing protein n=1 Tax=Basidiobolus meristosporus CBS 931.73 TaxID=1314790 RepID=A0A1Y1X0B0_9FUNG|nr:hypothetical protein K493DRAFT_342720 [Basidiobolus meristosporus CBS 931.73]|eukprot:ORX79251.1 hypothetical protein K493DRAFT_342720 [Basidiobolus meristosporus CBS 931.73]